MDKKKIEKTKENIGVDRLDEFERKKLFNRFVDKGGKVVDDSSQRRHLIIDRKKQKQYLSKIASNAPQPSPRNLRRQALKPAPDKSPARPRTVKQEPYRMGLFERLALHIKLRLLGVTTLGGYFFHPRFFKQFNSSYKQALMEIQILFLEIFMKDPPAGRRIIAKLDAIKPLYYEVLEMSGNLFDKILVDQILEQYVNFPEVPKRVSELRTQLMQLYRRLFILKPYENTVMRAFELAIDYHEKRGEKIKISGSSLKRRMRNALFVVFNKLVPRLALLFSLYERRPFDPHDPSIEALLGVTDEEKPGRRSVGQQKEEAPHPSMEESAEQAPAHDEDTPRQKAIRQGLTMMASLDMRTLRRQYDPQHQFASVSDADKVFIAYLLFNEFDYEYSFVLTTTKIKFRADFVDMTKVDFRETLNDLYDRMRKSREGLLAYVEELNNFEAARRERPVGGTQYIEFTKRLEALEKKRTAAGKAALASLRGYMEEVASKLQILLEDMEGPQIYVENPQDVLVFDPAIEGVKKIGGKKIYEAIFMVYSYAVAFVYRLSPGGDLSGALEFSPDEQEQMKKSGQDKTEEQRVGSSEEEVQSVLKELDNML